MINNLKEYIIPVPNLEKISNIKDVIILEKPERYDHDIKNKHHWTSKYVWEKIIPILEKDYNFQINKNEYKFIERKTLLGDFSYHLNTKNKFTYVDIENNIKLTGDASILRVKSDEPMWSDYHRLYRGAHRISYIINHSCNNGRVLLINGDSMTVPVIPIIANYFSKVICLDNRSKFDKKIPNLINWNEITDYMAMFTTIGYTQKKLPSLYLHPYLK